MLLTLTQVAGRLGVSEKTARMIARELPSVRVGKRSRYLSEEVEKYVRSMEVPAPASNAIDATVQPGA
jgi:excisionase family DNA binding protein